MQADDASTELRLLSGHRDNLIADRTRLINQRHAQMLQRDPQYQEHRGPLTRAGGVGYCQEFDPPHADALARSRLLIVRQLAARIAALMTELAELTALLAQRVDALGTPLAQLRGVGPIVAARLLGELGRPLRVHSAAALAALAGLAPVAVASGGRHGHRMNFGGQPPAQSRHPHHRADPAALRTPGAGLRRQETRRGQDGPRGDALPQAPPGRRALPALACPA